MRLIISLGAIAGGQLTNICTWSLLTTPRTICISKASHVCLTSSRTRTATSPVNTVVTILRDPNKVVLYLVCRVAAVPVIHAALQTFQYSIAAKADRLKPVV